MTGQQTPARVRVSTLASTEHTPWAECDGCEWERGPEGQSWPATRAAAHRHARATGHVVHAGYGVIYAYGVVPRIDAP